MSVFKNVVVANLRNRFGRRRTICVFEFSVIGFEMSIRCGDGRRLPVTQSKIRQFPIPQRVLRKNADKITICLTSNDTKSKFSRIDCQENSRHLRPKEIFFRVFVVAAVSIKKPLSRLSRNRPPRNGFTRCRGELWPGRLYGNFLHS